MDPLLTYSEAFRVISFWPAAFDGLVFGPGCYELVCEGVFEIVRWRFFGGFGFES